ncbi:MAG: hypothetical protein WDM85_14680 [Caulobacteraceae bacterium]
METDQAPLALRRRPLDRLGRELVALRRRREALGDVAPPVVRLQEEPP